MEGPRTTFFGDLQRETIETTDGTGRLVTPSALKLGATPRAAGHR